MRKNVFLSLTILLISFSSIAQTQSENLNMGLHQLQFPSANGGSNRIQSFGGTFPGTWLFKSRFDNITLDAGENSGNKYKILFLSGGIERARMDGNGRFGIGTTNPETSLHIQQTTRHNGLTISESDNSLKIKLHLAKFDNGTEYGFFDLGGNTKLRGNGQNSSFDGNVGIGTTTPDAKLSIYKPNATASYPNSSNSGDVFLKLKGSNNGLEFGNSTGFNDRKAWIVARHADVSNYGKYYSTLHLQPDLGDKSQYRGVSIGYEASAQLPVNTHLAISGNVGIGTTTPDAKLAVNGNIHTKEVKVDLTGWPDYVFEKNYNLPTLKEVENHITEKGHLENIPSAAHVEENGIQLGEMNAKLLQKIEELTLYMIEQNKKTENLIKEVEILKQKNAELEKKIK